MDKPKNQLLVIFGASGDLTKRKLIPSLYELYKQNLLPDKFGIVGVGRTKMSNLDFRERMNNDLITFGDDRSVEKAFLNRLFYFSMDTQNMEDYHQLAQNIKDTDKQIQTENNIIFYLSTPPSLYEIIPEGLAHAGLNQTNNLETIRRIIIEKPFGYNLKTAKKLNRHLLNYFPENQIYRIDHYLGKETVQNLLVTRFSNGIFEPLWNRNYIHHIEITASESLGVENRGGYYDKSGAMRDMVQNHLLQIAGLVAMEPPTEINSNAIRNEQLKVFQALRMYKPEEIEKHVIRGQYIASKIKGTKVKAYRDEKDVAPESRTETFVAMKLFIDNWRWGGVPFYIRTGKYLPTRVTEVVIHFKPTPHRLFNFNSASIANGNQLILRIQPDAGLLLKFGAKSPGIGFNVKDVNMDFHYSDLNDMKIPEAYQRLLLDAMKGDSTLYIRGDAVEQAWEFIDPVLEAWENNPDFPLHGYPAGTWGPDISDELIDGEDYTWRYPCRNLSNDGIFCEL